MHILFLKKYISKNEKYLLDRAMNPFVFIERVIFIHRCSINIVEKIVRQLMTYIIRS